MNTPTIVKKEYTVRYIAVQEVRVDATSPQNAISEAQRKLNGKALTLHSVVRGRANPL